MIWLRLLAGLAAVLAAFGAWLLVADLMRSVI
jgi:hypothetical protein